MKARFFMITALLVFLLSCSVYGVSIGENTFLPDEPNMERVREYVMSVNKKVIENGY